MQEKLLLDIRDLCVEYRTDEETVYAVNSVSIHINKGENVGLVGETGAGKTTIALGILRLIPHPPGLVTQGEILFEGADLLRVDNKKMRSVRGNDISMIFQDPMTSLNPVYTVGDQIAEVIRLHNKCSKKEGRELAEDMLEMVSIPKDRYDEYPHQFSGGMKQRVIIAMSIACSPKLILADEPTTALDVTIQAQVLELMIDLKRKLNTSLLLITHDLGVVAQVCDRVFIMYGGRIVESGAVEEILVYPHHPYTIGLLDSIPTLDEESDRLKPIKGLMPDPTIIPRGCAFAPRCPYASEMCFQCVPAVSFMGGTHEVRCLVYENKIESQALLKEVARGRQHT